MPIEAISEALKAPFPADAVSWRVGSTKKDKSAGLALAYIDARDVMDRLDDVVGPGCWQNKYTHANGKVVCDIGLKVDGEWVWKADGAGDTDVEAEKGALSDAFKRAAVRWGIGRYLYSLGNTWVELEAHGNSYSIKKSEFPKLEKHLKDHMANSGYELLSRDEARALYKTLQKEMTGILDLPGLSDWEKIRDLEIKKLGKWAMFLRAEISRHREAIVQHKEKAA